MTPTPAADPERYARPLTLAGLGLGLVGLWLGSPAGWGLFFAGVGLILAGCYSGRDGFLLAGPFVRLELVRATRKSRLLLWRALLVLGVSAPFVIGYYFAAEAPPGSRIPPKRVAAVAEMMLLYVGWNTFLVFGPMTMQFLASSVAEDRDAKRLDYLLVTDLRNREVVVGKALGRSLVMGSYALALLPLAILLPALFGLDAIIMLFLAGFAGASLLSIGGVSLVGSVYGPNKKKAGGRAAVIGFAYLAVSGAAYWAVVQLGAVSQPVVPGWEGGPTFGGAAEDLNVGNPVVLIIRIAPAAAGGATVGALLDREFWPFARFHLAVFLAATVLAVWRLRAASAWLAGEPAGGDPKGEGPRRPAVWDRPVVWKEVHCNSFLPKTRAGRVSARISGVLLAYIPAAVILFAGLAAPVWGPAVRDLTKGVIPIVALIAVVSGMNIASAGLARERERDTLVSLITTCLTPRDVLREKFWGALLFMLKGGGLWVLLIAVPTAVVGFWPWWAVLALVLVVAANLPLYVAWGLYAAAGAATAEKAAKVTGLGLLLGWTAVALLVGGMAALLAAATGTGEPAKFLAPLVPPVAFFLPAHAEMAKGGEIAGWAVGYALNIALAVGGTALLLRAAARRFTRWCADPEAGRPDTTPVAESP